MAYGLWLTSPGSRVSEWAQYGITPHTSQSLILRTPQTSELLNLLAVAGAGSIQPVLALDVIRPRVVYGITRCYSAPRNPERPYKASGQLSCQPNLVTKAAPLGQEHVSCQLLLARAFSSLKPETA